MKTKEFMAKVRSLEFEIEMEGLTPSSVPNFIHENLSRWVP